MTDTTTPTTTHPPRFLDVSTWVSRPPHPSETIHAQAPDASHVAVCERGNDTRLTEDPLWLTNVTAQVTCLECLEWVRA